MGTREIWIAICLNKLIGVEEDTFVHNAEGLSKCIIQRKFQLYLPDKVLCESRLSKTIKIYPQDSWLFFAKSIIVTDSFSPNSWIFKGSSKQEAQAYLRLCAHGLSWTVNVCIDLKFSCGVVSWSLAREKSIEFNSNNKWLSGYVMVIYLTACFRTSKYCLQQIATYGWETRILIRKCYVLNTLV